MRFKDFFFEFQFILCFVFSREQKWRTSRCFHHPSAIPAIPPPPPPPPSLPAAPPSQQQDQQSQSTSVGTIGLSNCVGRSEITTIALNDVGSSSFNHVIHPNHLNETALHHHHHASAENADASANGEHQSHFIYIHSRCLLITIADSNPANIIIGKSWSFF